MHNWRPVTCETIFNDLTYMQLKTQKGGKNGAPKNTLQK